MANNTNVNKVSYNNTVLIDLTEDTITPEVVVSGYTAHDRSGASIEGTFVPVTGVKGSSESSYRTGNVNLTPADIGALPSSTSVCAKVGSSTIVSIPEAYSADALDITIAIEPVQSGSGDPSPTNVRPISGWTGANVTRTGKNLFNLNDLVLGTYYTINSDGSVTVAKSDMRGWNTLDVIPISAGTYTFSQTGSTNGATVAYCFASEGYATIYYLTAGTPSRTVTLAADDYFKIKIGTSASAYPVTMKVQIELGTTATAYEPYTGTTYPISWQSEAGTVYGGTLDVTTGLLTVDKFGAVLDGDNIVATSLENYTFNSRFGIHYNTAKNPQAKYNSRDTYCLCDRVNPSYNDVIGLSATTPAIYAIYPHSSSIFLTLPAADFQTVAACNAWLQSNPVTVVYELATPQTYQLSSTDVALLLGINNVWADTGKTTVEYLKADSLSISRAICASIDGIPIATENRNGLMSAADKTKSDSIEIATLSEFKTYLGIT